MKIFNLVIMTKEDYEQRLSDVFLEGVLANKEIEEDFKKLQKKTLWSTIRPVVHSLKELRNNTWDTDCVDTAIKYLTDNFEVEDERTSNTSTNQDSE